LMLPLVAQCGRLAIYLGPTLRADRDVILAAILTYDVALYSATWELQNDVRLQRTAMFTRFRRPTVRTFDWIKHQSKLFAQRAPSYRQRRKKFANKRKQRARILLQRQMYDAAPSRRHRQYLHLRELTSRAVEKLPVRQQHEVHVLQKRLGRRVVRRRCTAMPQHLPEWNQLQSLLDSSLESPSTRRCSDRRRLQLLRSLKPHEREQLIPQKKVQHVEKQSASLRRAEQKAWQLARRNRRNSIRHLKKDSKHCRPTCGKAFAALDMEVEWEVACGAFLMDDDF